MSSADPQSGYIYAIQNSSGYWPKLYLNGVYYVVNMVGGPQADGQWKAAQWADVETIIEGEQIGESVTYNDNGEHTIHKYKAKTTCGFQQHDHVENNCELQCEKHVHNAECYRDTTYMEPVGSAPVHGFTTDTGIEIKGDGTSIVNVYYQYKRYTLKFYYASSTTADGKTTYKVFGGTS